MRRIGDRQLIETNDLRYGFLTMMSHELRTPLNSIIGYSEILQEGLDGPLTPDQADSVERILRNAQCLLAIINDVLDLASLAAGVLPLNPRQIDLVEIIPPLLEVILPRAEQKGLAVTLEGLEETFEVYTDSAGLRRVLLEILQNAVKFTQTGFIHLAVKPMAGRVTISISDSGIGIPAAVMPHLFDAFYQVDNGMTREYGGTGLGLAIAKQLLIRLHGQIEVESEPGKGSTFRLSLPQSESTLL